MHLVNKLFSADIFDVPAAILIQLVLDTGVRADGCFHSVAFEPSYDASRLFFSGHVGLIGLTHVIADHVLTAQVSLQLIGLLLHANVLH